MAPGIPAQLFSGVKSKEPNLNDSPAAYRMEARTLSISNTNPLLQGGWSTSTHLKILNTFTHTIYTLGSNLGRQLPTQGV